MAALRLLLPLRLTPLLLAAAALVAPGAAAESTHYSVNWAGYAAFGTSFSEVRGSWVHPPADCLGHATGTAAAFWVGLGGYVARSHKVEQIGTGADCTNGGKPDHYAWYELFPAPVVYVPLRVEPGDRMAGVVRVRGSRVTLQLRNVSTGKSFSKTIRMRAPDTSSAQWIAEAPSVTVSKRDHLVPLTDFGAVTFTGARATSTTGRSGGISDKGWQSERVLFWSTDGGGHPADALVAQATEAHVIPSPLVASGASFSATWAAGPPQQPRPAKPKTGTTSAL